MSFKTIFDVFEYHSTVKADKNLVKRITNITYRFINKNDTHTQFFGSALVGVRPVRYIPSDALQWLEEVCEIEDPKECQEDLFSVPGVERNFIVASDVVNLSFIYILKKLEDSKISKQDKELAKQTVLLMCFSKHVCGLLTHRFKFPSDELLAQQLYESLDKRSLLKRTGNWLAMLQYLAVTTLDPKEGIHTRRKTWQKMTDTGSVIYMCGDLQDRLRSQINILTSHYHDLKNSSDRLLTRSSVNEIDGEEFAAEYISKERTLVRDMQRIAIDPRAFIKDELVENVLDIIQTADIKYFSETLDFFVDNYRSDDLYERALNSVVLYVMKEAREGKLNLGDIPAVIGRLKSIFRASRTKKQEALDIKANFRELSEKAIPKANDNMKTATSIALIIYIALRMLTIKRYS